MNKVAVLLSVYQGEKYLASLLESLLNQSYRHFDLCVRFDGVHKLSLSILNDFIPKFSSVNINVIIIQGANVGASKSFLSLLESFEYKYYLYCDQDDVWNKCKIGRMVKELRSSNLVWHDMTVMDERRSYYDNLDTSTELPSILFYNNVAGCSMGFDEKVRGKLLQIEGYQCLVYHDWAAILVASLEKMKVKYCEESLVQYRLHDSNTVGLPKIVPNYSKIKSSLMVREKVVRQCEVLTKHYKEITGIVELYKSNTIPKGRLKEFFSKKTNIFIYRWIVYKLYHLGM